MQATPHGLTEAEAKKRFAEYGPNKLPDKTRNPILVYLGYLWNPLSWAMEVAAIISIALLDYADFALIVALLLVNATISYVEESNADKAIKVGCCSSAELGKAAAMPSQSLWQVFHVGTSLMGLHGSCLRLHRPWQLPLLPRQRQYVMVKLLI
jgi:hypothetical protein